MAKTTKPVVKAYPETEGNVVFLTWSGSFSKAIAKELREWLPKVLQSVEPWMSEEDIEKGVLWTPEIAKVLDATRIGIVCMTAENLISPWIHYEAGAIAKTVNRSRVCPYLFGLVPSQLTGPLTLHQCTAAGDKEDTRKLIHTINNNLTKPLQKQRADESFDIYWGKHKDQLDKIGQANKEGAFAKAPKRETGEMLEEVLSLIRNSSQNVSQMQAKLNLILPRLLHNYPDFATAYGAYGLDAESIGKLYEAAIEGQPSSARSRYMDLPTAGYPYMEYPPKKDRPT